MRLELLPLSAATYDPHELHRPDRVWEQTNCSMDAWIEVLHSLGLEPVAAAAFAVATDFEGDQWTFYKFPPEDLWSTYGIDVHEMSPWRNPLDHVVEQLRRGRLMTVEVDSFFLPDTQGVSYRLTHVKSTIVVNSVDTGSRRLGYFHNSGYHELEGDDFDGVFRLGRHADPTALVPYTELVRLERLRRDPAPALAVHAAALLDKHLALRPQDNPVERLAARVTEDLSWLQEEEPQRFHDYAFVTVRQCGAAAETAAAFCAWLAELDAQRAGPLRESARHWTLLAEAARAAQLRLARLARGRGASLEDTWAGMAGHWAAAQEALDALSSS